MASSSDLLIKNARLINEGRITEADLLVRGTRIEKIASSIDAGDAHILVALEQVSSDLAHRHHRDFNVVRVATKLTDLSTKVLDALLNIGHRHIDRHPAISPLRSVTHAEWPHHTENDWRPARLLRLGLEPNGIKVYQFTAILRLCAIK